MSALAAASTLDTETRAFRLALKEIVRKWTVYYQEADHQMRMLSGGNSLSGRRMRLSLSLDNLKQHEVARGTRARATRVLQQMVPLFRAAIRVDNHRYTRPRNYDYALAKSDLAVRLRLLFGLWPSNYLPAALMSDLMALQQFPELMKHLEVRIVDLTARKVVDAPASRYAQQRDANRELYNKIVQQVSLSDEEKKRLKHALTNHRLA